jgi:hypothetical protein
MTLLMKARFHAAGPHTWKIEKQAENPPRSYFAS